MAGDQLATMTTKGRGAANTKAKREFSWQPLYPSWREGFVNGLTERSPQIADPLCLLELEPLVRERELLDRDVRSFRIERPTTQLDRECSKEPPREHDLRVVLAPQLDQDVTPSAWIAVAHLVAARPVRWSGPDFDAMESRIAYEELELAFDDLVWLEQNEERGGRRGSSA